MSVNIRILAIVAFAALFAASHTYAQQGVRHYSSSTGFFVTADGLLITNAHVVKGCESISLAGSVKAAADVIALDPTHDLALLRAHVDAPKVAPLRFDISHMRNGQNVAVVGYPGQAGFRGELVYRSAQLLGFEGPIGEPHFLQFTPSAEKGNSGGPLLDKSGNVVGVVTGKTQLYQVDKTSPNAQPVLLREADVAVTLPYLKNFLGQYGVRHNVGGSGLVNVTNRYIAETASQYIVHIRCLLPTGTQ